jgi:S1-C subfamily serine protease
MIAVSPADIDAMLKDGRSEEGRVLATFGLRLDRLSADEAAHFRIAGGVVVREVWDGDAAALSGLRAGDIVRAVGGQPVASLEAARMLLLSTAEPVIPMVVRRTAAEMAINLTRGQGETAPSQEASLGIVWEGRRRGYPIDEVLPGSAAARAGLQHGDVVLRVDHAEPRSLAELQRRLAGNRSTSFLEIRRGPRRLGVLLPPSP